MSSIAHIYIYGQIKKEVGNGNLIHISELYQIVKWHLRIPLMYQKEFIREMVKKGFLKKVGRDNYEISTLRIKPLCDSLGEPLW